MPRISPSTPNPDMLKRQCRESRAGWRARRRTYKFPLLNVMDKVRSLLHEMEEFGATMKTNHNCWEFHANAKLTVKEHLCTPDTKLLAVTFCPNCLSREFTCISCQWCGMWHHQLNCCQVTHTTPQCIHGDLCKFHTCLSLSSVFNFFMN